MEKGKVEDRIKAVTPGGCVQPYISGFIDDMAASGFADHTTLICARAGAHLGRWMDLQGVGLPQLTDDPIAQFVRHRCRCPRSGCHGRQPTARFISRAMRFIDYLRHLEVVPPAALEDIAIPPSMEGFRAWMMDQRGLSEVTVQRHESLLRKLVPSLGDDVEAYDADRVRRVLLDAVRALSPGYAKHFVEALRTFLRFQAAQGRCSAYLVDAVPAVAQWRLASLPRFLEAPDVERVIASCDLRKSSGLRDRAVLLLLARLGLRAGDIVAMSLGDIDWEAAKLRVRGKGRKEVWLPLPQDAGDALLEYLGNARPAAATDRVFLCSQAPVRPFKSSRSVSEITRRALHRAGIKDPPSHGAHLLRHSAATSMLRSGASLDTIATVLRHESTDTTAYYAKVDTHLLALIVQPWPEGAPC